MNIKSQKDLNNLLQICEGLYTQEKFTKFFQYISDARIAGDELLEASMQFIGAEAAIYVLQEFITHHVQPSAIEAFLFRGLQTDANIGRANPFYVELANFYMMKEQFEIAYEYAQKGLRAFPNNIYTQDIFIQLQKLLGKISENEYALAGKICLEPFTHYELTPKGGTYCCCPGYLPSSIGDHEKLPQNEIWNGPRIQKIRKSILDGTYKYCSKLYCPKISSNELKTKEDIISADSKVKQVVKGAIKNEQSILDFGPDFLNLSHDRSCNLTCPSCRKDLFIAKEHERDKYDKIKDTIILPALMDASRVHITGSGDPFASKHFRSILNEINKERFPNLRVAIQTNGILLTVEEWEKYPNLEGVVSVIIVSIDATEGDTYKKLRLRGDFLKLHKNMKFLSQLRQEKKIPCLQIAFVVQKDNYKEMKKFIELGNAWSVDQIIFSKVRQWGAFTTQEFTDINIFDPAHKLYSDMMKELDDIRSLYPQVYLGNLFGG